MVTRSTTCRIVETGTAHPGHWNMACDEWLLDSVLHSGQPTVRVYAWSRPTVSLGYFQQTDALNANPHIVGLDNVQRLSGGGAIVHHHEWTYSCVVPASDPNSSSRTDLYELVHLALVDQLVTLAGGTIAGLGLRGVVDDAGKPALCFARSAAEDVVCGKHKVIGSAQRRRRGAVLQHGSLLLRNSPHAPEFLGLEDLVPELVLPGDFPDLMARAIAESLGWQFAHKPISNVESREIRQRAGQPDDPQSGHAARLSSTFRS